MITTDELRILLKINGAATYTKTINEVTNVTKNYNKSIGSLTATLAKLVSAGMVMKFAKQCVDSASRLQEVANVVDVTFGKNADIVNKWAKEQAAGFGLSKTAAKQYIGTYGTMAKQFNMTTDQATKMGVELTKLTGDVASFYNIADSAAAVKLKSVFTGETESLKELGVVMTETQLNAFAMSKGFGKTVKDMTEQEKVLLRYQFTLEKLSHAQGDFARTSDGFANASRTLQLTLENLRIEIGKELIPVAARGIQALNTGIRLISEPLINAAKYVKYYAEAWKNASATTKAFVTLSLGAFAILAAAPKVIAVTRAAIKLLTADAITLTAVLKGLLGFAGLLLAASAVKALTDQVKDIKAADAAQQLENLGATAETGAGAVDALSNALDGLGESAEGLETFLASFDEVNKVGGKNSLMSSVLNDNDLANIMAAAGGLNDLNGIIDGIEANMNGLENNDFFSFTWWKGKAANAINEMKLIGSVGLSIIGSFSPAIRIASGIISAILDSIKKKIEGVFDAIMQKYNEIKAIASIGFNIGSAVIKSKTGADISNSKALSVADKFTGFTNIAKAALGITRHSGGGWPNKGSLFLAGETGAELVGNFGGSQTKVLNQSQMNGGSSPAPIMFSPVIQIDGRKITSVVLDYANNMVRSASESPMIQLG